MSSKKPTTPKYHLIQARRSIVVHNSLKIQIINANDECH